MARNEDEHNNSDDSTPIDTATGGSSTHDYGGIDKQLEGVDLEHAEDVGADPPGGLGLDIGGGTGGFGTADESDQSAG